jgi:hypothetical protein
MAAHRFDRTSASSDREAGHWLMLEVTMLIFQSLHRSRASSVLLRSQTNCRPERPVHRVSLDLIDATGGGR